MLKKRLLFYISAGTEFGSGHFYRSVHIIRHLSLNHYNIYFSGNIANEFIYKIKSNKFKYLNKSELDGYKFELTIIDFMFKGSNDEICDYKFIEGLNSICEKSIFISSFLYDPSLLPVDIFISFLPNIPNLEQCKDSVIIHNGFEFAPSLTQNEVRSLNKPELSEYCLISFGHGTPLATLRKTINRLHEVKFCGKIVIFHNDKNILQLLKIKPVNIIILDSKDNDIFSYAKFSSFVITTYGHFMFECIGVGAPLFVVGQKKFMEVYTLALEKSFRIKWLNNLTKTELKNTIEYNFKRKSPGLNYLSDGYYNIANIILKNLQL